MAATKALVREVRAITTLVDELMIQRDNLLHAIQCIEWSYADSNELCCPMCGAAKPKGHSWTCVVGAAIARAERRAE